MSSSSSDSDSELDSSSSFSFWFDLLLFAFYSDYWVNEAIFLSKADVVVEGYEGADAGAADGAGTGIAASA